MPGKRLPGYAMLRAMGSDRDELRRLHADALRAYKRGMRRAWLLVALTAAAGAAGALSGRLLAEHLHLPLWASLLIGAAGLVHGWALLFPAGRVDMILHRIWRTQCKHTTGKRLPRGTGPR